MINDEKIVLVSFSTSLICISGQFLSEIRIRFFFRKFSYQIFPYEIIKIIKIIKMVLHICIKDILIILFEILDLAWNI